MSRPGPVTHAVISLALWPLIIIFSPVIILAGEPVSRYVMRRVRRNASTAQIAVVRHGGPSARAAAVRLPPATSLLLTVISNPLWIALTAPGRPGSTQPHAGRNVHQRGGQAPSRPS